MTDHFIHLKHRASSQMTGNRVRQKAKERSPDDTSQWCKSKVIALPRCKQCTRSKGGKDNITSIEAVPP